PTRNRPFKSNTETLHRKWLRYRGRVNMIPSKLDNKYVQDPALLERTRRQAELFGTSVEALTRMGVSFLSLKDVMHSKTIKIYADIRQNGALRTVMLGDFGSESSEKGLGGFHAACLFGQ
ncbi:MAG: hypothetical protein AAF986_11165, partial [Pseudomonadota bacterium]